MKKFLTTLLCIAMILTFMPTSVFAAETAVVPVPQEITSKDGSGIYYMGTVADGDYTRNVLIANGNPVTIDKKGDTTVATICGDEVDIHWGVVFGGGIEGDIPSADITMNGGNVWHLIGSNWKTGTVKDSNITVNGGWVDFLYGNKAGDGKKGYLDGSGGTTIEDGVTTIGDYHVGNFHLKITDGTFYAAVIGAFGHTTIDNVTMDISGGIFNKDANPNQTGIILAGTNGVVKTAVLNFSGGKTAGISLAQRGVVTDKVTMNIKSGDVGAIYAGSFCNDVGMKWGKEARFGEINYGQAAAYEINIGSSVKYTNIYQGFQFNEAYKDFLVDKSDDIAKLPYSLLENAQNAPVNIYLEAEPTKVTGENETRCVDIFTSDLPNVKITRPSPYIPTPVPSDNVTNNAVDKSTTADLSTATEAGGKTTATVDQTTADKIVDKAVANSSETVIIDATTTRADSKTTEVKIPVETIKALVEKTDTDIIAKTDTAEMILDQKAAAAVAEQAKTGIVTLIVEKVKENDSLLQMQLKILTANGDVIDFKGGNVKVTVKVPTGLKDKDVVCVYIDDNGVYTKISGIKNDDGTYTFTTGHFSTYAVMTVEEANKVIAEQEAAKTAQLKKGVQTTTLKASSKAGKGYIKVSWKKSYGYKVDYYQVFRSTKKNSGYGTKAFYTTKSGKQTTYKNTKSVKKGTRYYYKIRGVRVLDGKNVFTKWSNKAIRTAK